MGITHAPPPSHISANPVRNHETHEEDREEKIQCYVDARAFGSRVEEDESVDGGETHGDLWPRGVRLNGDIGLYSKVRVLTVPIAK